MKFVQVENMHIDVEKIEFIQEEMQYCSPPAIVLYYIGRVFRIHSVSPKWSEIQALLPSSYLKIQSAYSTYIDAAKISYVREEAQSEGQPVCVIHYNDRELRVLKGSPEWNQLEAKMYGKAQR